MSDDSPFDTPAAPERSRWTTQFEIQVGELPLQVQRLVLKAIRLREENPKHGSLRLHPLKDSKRGRHESGSYSISLNMKYRAIFVMDGATAIWYWAGSHADYDRLIGDG